MTPVRIASPDIGPEERAAVERVLRSGMLTQGPVVEEFEQAISAHCGVEHAVAVNSGTAALHCALHAVGVGPGDEVVTTPFTFVATANAILMQGGRVRFADIGYDDFNLDPARVREAIGPRTKAIVTVDLYGQPCDYDALQEIAAAAGVALVEDACQAIGARYRDGRAGGFGDVGCFSLYATKNIVAGEGGVLTTDSADHAADARRFRQHGMTGPYEYADLGMNYRMTDIAGAIALEQFQRLDELTEARRRNSSLLHEALQGIPGIVTPVTLPDRDHVFHQYTIRITADFPVSRDSVATLLARHDVHTGVYYPRLLHEYEHVARATVGSTDCPVAERAVQEVLALPVHPAVTEEDILGMTDLIRGVCSGR